MSTSFSETIALRRAESEEVPSSQGIPLRSLNVEEASTTGRVYEGPSAFTAFRSKLRWPPQIYYIMGNEVCERFSFYGMRAILVVYMTEHLQISDSSAESAFHAFTAACYLLPLVGGWLADNVLGKYLVILYLSTFYCLGHGVLAVWESRAGLAFGLALIAIGAGGIKPCVAAMVGDQFDETNKEHLPSVFATFYWCINLGSFTAIAATPTIMEASVFWAFSVPGMFMLVALVVFWLGRRLYRSNGPQRDRPAGFVKVTSSAVWHAWRNKPGQGFWDAVSGRFTAEEIDAAQAVAGLLQLFACLSIASALFDQHSSTWVVQAQHMDLDVFGWKIPASQMQVLNPVLVMILIPVFETLVYPAAAALGFKLTPLRKMSTGMVLTSSSFVIIACLQIVLDAGNQLSVLWQAPAYVMLTGGEVLTSVTGLQFAYTQAPVCMKSVIMSLWLLTVFLGNLLDAVVTKLNFFSGPLFFAFFALLMYLVTLLFMWTATNYSMRDYADSDALKCKQSDDGAPEDGSLLLTDNQNHLDNAEVSSTRIQQS